MRAAEDYHNDVECDDKIYKDFPPQIHSNSSILSFPTSWLIRTADIFVFMVKVSTSDPYRRHNDAILVLKINPEYEEWVRIGCQNCRDGKVARHLAIHFDAWCPKCGNETDSRNLHYEWSMHEVGDDSASFYKNETNNCAPRDGHGWMSIVGVFGSASDYFNESQSNPFLTTFANQTTNESAHEDPGFYGNTIPDDLLNQPWPKQGKNVKSPRSPISGDISEGRFDTNIGRMDGNTDDEGIPKQPLRILRSAPSYEDDNAQSEGNEASSGESNMRGGYFGGHNPLGPAPSVEEAEVEYSPSNPRGWNSGPYGTEGYNQNSGGGWGNYRSGTIPFSPPAPVDSPLYHNTPLRVDPFRSNRPTVPTAPTADHYQDSKHIALDLKPITLSGIHHKTLILRPNVLSEGKTYSATMEVSDKVSSKKIGKTSYYFTVLRGPSYGDCSVLYRAESYWIHCAGWKNQQNDNAKDVVSRKEMLNFDMSYSLVRNGPRRQIYTGVSNEKSFHLPQGDKPADIHIVLRNSDGATTNVCSFLPEGPQHNRTVPEEDLLRQVYGQAVPKEGVLNRLVALGNQEEIVALSNVILDTIPEDEVLAEIEDTLGIPAMREARDTVYGIIMALKSIPPTKIYEVQFVIETLTRALTRGQLVSVKAFFEAAQLFISCIHTLDSILENGGDEWGEYILSDEDIVKMLITVRLRLTTSCFSCGRRLRTNPDPEEIREAKEMLYLNSHVEDTQHISIKNEFTERENEVYQQLNKFFLGVARRRHHVLGPLRSVVDGYGIVVQPYNGVVQLFNDDRVVFGESGSWKVGAVFPETVKNKLSQDRTLSNFYMAASNLPDITLSNYDQFCVEKRHLWLAIYNSSSSEVRLRRLAKPVVIALPPRKREKVPALRGIVSRDRVTANGFRVHKLPNRTLHLEIKLQASHQRSFPVSIAIAKRKYDETGPPDSPEIVTKRVVSRGDFKKFHALNESVVVKLTLRDEDIPRKHGLFHVVFWNEQAMTSRSRHYDIETVAYTLRIWWSDCFYWDEFLKKWKQDGVQTSELSTSTQTLCKTQHLSSFSASFLPVRAGIQKSDIGIAIIDTALRGSITLLVILFIGVTLVLYVHHRILRPRELETPTSVFRADYYHSRPRFSEIGRRLRWLFGPDHKSGAVPVILHDNRKSHKQIFEVTVQTCCWPSSGTTSNVNMVMYGEDGKYEARELITLKTHNAREARYENGYSENDEYTGVDDELFITGSTQKFIITYPENLGPLWKLVVWHDNSGECPGWKLDYITVRDTNNERKWHFPHYGWLAVDRGKKSLSGDLRPVYTPPSFCMQIGLKLNSFLCNFSSVCSLVASPGYGRLSRSQRAIHFFTLLVAVCGLTTARYMLGWGIYSHDTDLPYIHTVSITWGLLIGLIASIIVLPAQLLLRFSKYDERISVMIEDVTESLRGSDFPNDFGSYRYASSLSVSKPPDEHVRHLNNDCEHYQEEEDCQLPSVKDAVSDWLDLKAQPEREDAESPTRSKVDKDLHLPESRSIVSPSWRQSMNSLELDEQIVRCMRAGSSRSSQSIREDASPEKKQEAEIDAQDLRLAIPPQGQNASFMISPRLQRELHSMLQSGSLLADQYEGIGGIYHSVGSTLAMDGPEIVPCEKLEPLPQNFFLPRGCRKFAMCYYALVFLGACAVTLYGSFTMIRSYDVGPWLECILFAAIGVLLFIEGSFIFFLAIITSAYDSLKWTLSNENLWSLLDRAFSTSDASTVTENTLDVYIDSTTYYPTVDVCLSSSHADATVLEDARMARDIADRERSRYLRHVKPPATPTIGMENTIKTRRTKKAAAQWGSVMFLLILGIVSAGIVAGRFKESNAQSRDIENWFSLASAFPRSDGYITNDVYESMNRTSKVFKNVRTKKDWLEWFNQVFVRNPRNEDHQSSMGRRPSDLLRREPKTSNYAASVHKKYIRYMLVNSPTIRLIYCENALKEAPQIILSLLNFTASHPDVHSYDAGIFGRNGEVESANAQSSVDSTKTYQVTSSRGKMSKTWTSVGGLKKTLQEDRSLLSIEVGFILYNPYSNLYSDVLAKVRFSSASHSENSVQNSVPATVQVSSVSLSQAGVDRTCPSAAHQSYYLCQILFLCWAAYKVARAVISWTNWILKRLLKSVHASDERKKKREHFFITKWSNMLLDFVIWILVVLSLIFSAEKRSKVERIMPCIYGYENETWYRYDVVLSQIIQSSARLATVFGLLNFLLVVKVLVISRTFHNFPRVPAYTKRNKSTIGEIIVVLAIFWTAALILAGIGYLLFSDERPFSSYISSLMNVILSSISLGNFPAHPKTDFTVFRAKYGTIITLCFFLTIFVTFRLLLKAIVIAVYRRRSKTRNVKSRKTSETVINFKELVLHVWGSLRYLGLCVVCIILRRDPGLWPAHANVEFNSLEFPNSKALTEREKRKLGYTASNKSQPSATAKERVEECKSNEEKETYPTGKYKLSTEAWLSEVDSQLDELYSRASTLADMACNNTPEDDQESTNITVDTGGDQEESEGKEPTSELPAAKRIVVATKTDQPLTDDDAATTTDTAPTNEIKSQNNLEFTAQKPPIRRSPEENRSKEYKKIHPRQTKSSILSKQKISPSHSERDDSGISIPSRNSTTGHHERGRTQRIPVNQQRATAPVTKKIHARRGQRQGTEWSQPIATSVQGGRKHGWISDDDLLERSSDVSTISSSSFRISETPVPPLTQHNLERHNCRVFSRQASAATRGTTASGRTTTFADEPSTSTAPCQDLPEPEATLTQKIWKHFSSFKEYLRKKEDPQTTEAKAQPLRRTRTATINIKDLPNFTIHNDSDADSDKTGKKSSASTTKMRSAFTITKLGLGGTKVQSLEPGPKTSFPDLKARQSELTSLQLPISSSCIHEDFETFSIPGTVRSTSLSRPSQVGQKSVSPKNLQEL